jgi:hypothetical protein
LPRLRFLLCLAAVLALLAPAAAVANHEGGAPSGQPTQAPPTAPAPAGTQQESDDGTSTLAAVGVLAGLLVSGGALIAFTQRRTGRTSPDSH